MYKLTTYGYGPDRYFHSYREALEVAKLYKRYRITPVH